MYAEVLQGVSPLDVPRLGKVLLMSTSADRRAWAARALAEAGHLSAYAYLRRAFWDRDEQVRESAVSAVADLAVSQCAGELAAVYAWSGPRVRRAVLRAAARIRADFAGLFFLAAADSDREVRVLAARAARAQARISAPVAARVVGQRGDTSERIQRRA